MGPAVSVVVPAYNEGARLATTLPPLLERAVADGMELLVVDDGSVDNTSAVAEDLLRRVRNARVISLPRNSGKGAAVRAGVLDATGSTVVYMDADLATDLDDLDRLLGSLEDADVVVGSRALEGALVIGGTRARALMGRTWNAMVRPVVGLGLRDTQCGFKGFRALAARTLFEQSRVERFAFDVEVLALAHRLGMRIVEIPVTWRAVDGTKVRPIVDSVGMSRDLVRIARRVRRIRPVGNRWTPQTDAPWCREART